MIRSFQKFRNQIDTTSWSDKNDIKSSRCDLILELFLDGQHTEVNVYMNFSELKMISIRPDYMFLFSFHRKDHLPSQGSRVVLFKKVFHLFHFGNDFQLGRFDLIVECWVLLHRLCRNYIISIQLD